MKTSRSDEIRTLLQLTPDEVIERAGRHLVVCDDLDALHRHMAQSIADEIVTNNEEGLPTRLILPVGPTGQYEHLVQLIAQQDISLVNCWFFFMDEYCDDEGRTLLSTHPLSFKGVAERSFLQKLPLNTGLSAEQVIFPDEANVIDLDFMIAQDGGIGTCYGGIGIHGHVAFNEPEAGVGNSSIRRVRLNDFTVTINAIRAGVGGNLENFPRMAYTLGMKEIREAQRIRLYCRNGSAYDWANTILRLAVLGAVGDDYPVTHIRNHADYVIITDRETLQSPQHII